MGIPGISPWSLLLILFIVILVFGTKRLKTIGRDLGSAIRGFKRGVEEDEEKGDKMDKKSDEDEEGKSE